MHALLSLPDKVAKRGRAAAEPSQEQPLRGSPRGKRLSVGEPWSSSYYIKKKAVVGRLAPHSLRCGKAGEVAGEKVAAVWVNVCQRCLPSQVPNAEASWSAARLNRAKCSHPTARCAWSEWLLQPRVSILHLPPHSCGSPHAQSSQVWDAGKLLPAR